MTEVAAKRTSTVKESGGLFVIGTERHESRRIDNQLRGRSGRQGDPGRSAASSCRLEDDLMRIFGSERMGGMLQKPGVEGGRGDRPSAGSTRRWKSAQKKVEARNFDTRKNLLKYDDVMNRPAASEVYGAAPRIHAAPSDVSETIAEMRAEVIDAISSACRIPEKAFSRAVGNRGAGRRGLPAACWGSIFPSPPGRREEGVDEAAIRDRITAAALAHDRGQGWPTFGPDVLRYRGKVNCCCNTLGRGVEGASAQSWTSCARASTCVSYGQRDPLNEYKHEAFALFNAMLVDLKERVTSLLARIAIQQAPPPPEVLHPPAPIMVESHPAPSWGGAGHADSETALLERPATQPVQLREPATRPSVTDDPASWVNTPRNAPCPCGSGKKYKHCHGKAG